MEKNIKIYSQIIELDLTEKFKIKKYVSETKSQKEYDQIKFIVPWVQYEDDIAKIQKNKLTKLKYSSELYL